MHCNDENLNKESYSVYCGEAGQCRFSCVVDKCFNSGTIFAANSDRLDVESAAYECMRKSTVYTPTGGTADFYIGDPTFSDIGTTEGAFKEMTIDDGIYTESITIDCTGDTRECRDLVINAQDTQFLRVRAGLYWNLWSDILLKNNPFCHGSIRILSYLVTYKQMMPRSILLLLIVHKTVCMLVLSLRRV